MPETEADVVRWLRTLEMVLGLGLTIYMVWLLCPPLRSAVLDEANRLHFRWNRKREREREVNEMAWQTFILAEYTGGEPLERYLDKRAG